jgi:polyisoprenoid-binding protein YceI
MKKINYFILGALAVFIMSCSQSPQGDRVSTSVAYAVQKPVVFADYVLDKTNSIVNWEGYKPAGKHFGTVKIIKGELGIHEGKLAGGFFDMDLNSIACLDLENENFNKKLVNHLKSEDFFNVAEFPTARFKISNVEPIDNAQANTEDGEISPTHNITGNLTIRGIAKSITFPAQVEMKENSIVAKSNQFILDRTEWGVNHKSKKIFKNLKDDFINDDMAIAFELKVDKV